MIILKLAIAALVISLAACQTDDSYRIGGDLTDRNGTPRHQSGSEIDPFDSAHSPG